MPSAWFNIGKPAGQTTRKRGRCKAKCAASPRRDGQSLRRPRALFFIFILLTAPNGNTVYFSADQIVAIQPAADWSSGASMITIGSGNQYYVKESAKEVFDKVVEATKK